MKNITREEIRKIYEDIEAGLKNMEEYGEFRCAEEKHKFRFAMYLGMYEAINTLASNVNEAHKMMQEEEDAVLLKRHYLV